MTLGAWQTMRLRFGLSQAISLCTSQYLAMRNTSSHSIAGTVANLYVTNPSCQPHHVFWLYLWPHFGHS